MSERVYRLLLKLYPAAFWRRFELDMVRAFRDRRQKAELERGVWGKVICTSRAALDAAVNGMLERLRVTDLRSYSQGAQKGGSGLDGLKRDVGYAVRTMLRMPGFTAVAVLTLGLGVGANTAIFSVLHGVLLRPLEYPNAERIVVLRDRSRQSGLTIDASAPNVEDWKAMSTSFEAVALVWGGAWAVTEDDLEAEQVPGGRVSAEVFDVLGIRPVAGRFFTPEENFGDPDLVVISHGLWQSRFGADPSAVGRTLTVDGRFRTIIGVLPPVPMPLNHAMVELTSAEGSHHIWIPIDEEDQWYGRRASHFTLALARLNHEATLVQAQAELSAIAAWLEERYPDSNTGLDAAVDPLRDLVVGEVQSELYLVLGAVTLVLVVACANLTNLLLARSVDRRREMAVRAALGAGGGRLISQALTEAAMLGLAGSAVGLGIAWLGTDLILTFTPQDLPRRAGIGLNGIVLSYALVLAVAASVGAALFPAWRMGRADSRGDVRGALVAGGSRSSSLGTALSSLRSALVVGQLAMAVLLLAGSGLLLRTLVELRSVDPGARTERVLSVPFYLSGVDYGDAQVNRTTQVTIRNAIAALPGVEEAVLAYDLPVASSWWERFTVVDRPPPEPGQAPVSGFRPVGAGYFEALDIPVVRGRTFHRGDRVGAPGAVVVNRALVDRFFPGEEAIGRRISTGTPRANFPEAPEEWTIVGIVENVGFSGPRGEYHPALYVPAAQFPVAYLQVLATTTVEPVTLVSAARNAVWSVDPNLPLPDVAPLSDEVDRLVARERFVAVIAGVFAVVALLLAGAGVYGVLSYSVASRRGELGVRMALGAAPGRVMASVLGRALTLASGGLALGVVGAVILGTVMSGFLFRVRPWDPAVLVGVIAVLSAVATLAVLLPARRAAGTDPVAALRAE